MAQISKAASLFPDIPAGPRAQYLAGWAKAADLLSAGKIPATHKIPAWILNYLRESVPSAYRAGLYDGNSAIYQHEHNRRNPVDPARAWFGYRDSCDQDAAFLAADRAEAEARAAAYKLADLVLVRRAGALVPGMIAANTRSADGGLLVYVQTSGLIATYVEVPATDLIDPPPGYPDFPAVIREKAGQLLRAEAEAAATAAALDAAFRSDAPDAPPSMFRVERVNEQAEEEDYGWRTAAVNARFPAGTPVYVVDPDDIHYGLSGTSRGPQYGLVHTTLVNDPATGRRGGIRWFTISALGTEAPPPLPPEEEAARAAPEAPTTVPAIHRAAQDRLHRDAEIAAELAATPPAPSRQITPVYYEFPPEEITPPPAAPARQGIRDSWTTAAGPDDQDYGIPPEAPLTTPATDPIIRYQDLRDDPDPAAISLGDVLEIVRRRAETAGAATVRAVPLGPGADAYIRDQYYAGYGQGVALAEAGALSARGELTAADLHAHYGEERSYPYRYSLTRACVDYARLGRDGMNADAAFAEYRHSRYYGLAGPGDPDRLRALVGGWGTGEEVGEDG